jgi:general stress protein CsbA
LTILPALYWLRSRFTPRKAAIGIGSLVALWLYLRLFSNFELFGYDYGRYLEGENTGGFPLFSILEMGALAFICKLVLPRQRVPNYVSLVGMVLLIKIIFGDIEVFSRVFQIEIDVVMVMAGMEARRNRSLIFLFGAGFFMLQLFFTPTADDVVVFHASALLNALSAW